MERIRLSRNEKAVLRMVASGQGVCPAEYPSYIFNASVRALKHLGLVQGAFEEGGGVVDSRMTERGRQYLAENPRLTNPIEWGKVAAIIGAVGIVVSIVALFMACGGI